MIMQEIYTGSLQNYAARTFFAKDKTDGEIRSVRFLQLFSLSQQLHIIILLSAPTKAAS